MILSALANKLCLMSRRVTSTYFVSEVISLKLQYKLLYGKKMYKNLLLRKYIKKKSVFRTCLTLIDNSNIIIIFFQAVELILWEMSMLRHSSLISYVHNIQQP